MKIPRKNIDKKEKERDNLKPRDTELMENDNINDDIFIENNFEE